MSSNQDNSITIATFFLQANVDGLPSNVARGKNLCFEISGEGSLPRVIVTEPKVRNSAGEPLLVFPRMYVGKSSSLQLILKNEGTCPSKVGGVIIRRSVSV